MDNQSTEERTEKVVIALTQEQLKELCANAAEIGARNHFIRIYAPEISV